MKNVFNRCYFNRTFYFCFLVTLIFWGCQSAKEPETPGINYSKKPLSELTPSKPTGLKILIFGIDGAEWDIIHSLVKAGRLPHIQQLMNQGTHGELLSLEPTLSPIIWTTIATGKLPEKHGIQGFTRIDPKTQVIIPISSRQRKTQAFWDIYSKSKWSVGIVSWLVSWPAEKVNGFLCSIYTYPPIFKVDIDPVHNQQLNTTYPDSLRTEIGEYLIAPDKLSDRVFQKEKLNALTQDYAKRYVFARDWSYRQMGLHLLDKYKPNVFAIYFDGTDAFSHYAFPMYKWYRWINYDEPTQVYISPDKPQDFKFMDQPIQEKTLPGYTPGKQSYILEQGEALEHYYEFMDETLGEYLKQTDNQTIIAVVSDHGFGINLGQEVMKTGDESYSQPTHWHKLHGVVLLKGPGIKINYHLKKSSVTDILPTLLYLSGYPIGKDMDGEILWEAIDGKWKSTHPAVMIDTYDLETTSLQEQNSSPKSPYDKEVLERLRSLGYIQ